MSRATTTDDASRSGNARRSNASPQSSRSVAPRAMSRRDDGADALEIVGQIGEGAFGRVMYARNRTGARVDRERESSRMARMNARARVIRATTR